MALKGNLRTMDIPGGFSRHKCLCIYNPSVRAHRLENAGAWVLLRLWKRQLMGSDIFCLPQGTPHSPTKHTIQFFLVHPFQPLLGGFQVHEGGQATQEVFHTPTICLNSIWNSIQVNTGWMSKAQLNIFHRGLPADLLHKKPALVRKVISSRMPCSCMHPVDTLVNKYLFCLDWAFYSPPECFCLPKFIC